MYFCHRKDKIVPLSGILKKVNPFFEKKRKNSCVLSWESKYGQVLRSAAKYKGIRSSVKKYKKQVEVPRNTMKYRSMLFPPCVLLATSNNSEPRWFLNLSRTTVARDLRFSVIERDMWEKTVNVKTVL